MSKIEKAILSACPAISGSLFRIYMGVHISKTGGRKGTLICLLISLAGMIINWQISSNTSLVNLNSSKPEYFGLIIGGLIAGFGIYLLFLNVLIGINIRKYI